MLLCLLQASYSACFRLSSLVGLPQAPPSPHLHLKRFGFLQAEAFPHPPPLASPGLPQALPCHPGQLRNCWQLYCLRFLPLQLKPLSFYFGWAAFDLSFVFLFGPISGCSYTGFFKPRVLGGGSLLLTPLSWPSAILLLFVASSH